MEVKYDGEGNIVQVRLNERKRAQTIEVNDFIRIRVDENGYPITITLQGTDKYVERPQPEFSEYPQGNYVTVNQMAKSKGVNPVTIKRHIQDGLIGGAVKVGSEWGGKWFIPVDVAEAWEPKPVGRPKKESST